MGGDGHTRGTHHPKQQTVVQTGALSLTEDEWREALSEELHQHPMDPGEDRCDWRYTIENEDRRSPLIAPTINQPPNGCNNAVKITKHGDGPRGGRMRKDACPRNA